MYIFIYSYFNYNNIMHKIYPIFILIIFFVLLGIVFLTRENNLVKSALDIMPDENELPEGYEITNVAEVSTPESFFSIELENEDKNILATLETYVQDMNHTKKIFSWHENEKDFEAKIKDTNCIGKKIEYYDSESYLVQHIEIVCMKRNVIVISNIFPISRGIEFDIDSEQNKEYAMELIKIILDKIK